MDDDRSHEDDGTALDASRPSLLTNISWLGLSNAAVKPFWFLFITAACMRVLGVQEYGVLSAAMSIAAIATSFVDLGMTQYSIREVSTDPNLASRHFSNFMTLRLGNSVVGWAAALAFAYVLGYRGTALGSVVFAGIYVFSLNITEYCRAFYRAFERLKYESILLVLEKAAVIGAGLWLLVTTRSAQWTLAGMAAGMVAVTAIHVGWIHYRLAPIQPALVTVGFLKKSLRVMIPFGLAGLFINMYYKVDIIMIEAYLGEGPTGQYGAAYRILEALNALPTIIAIAAVYPRMSRLRSIGDWPGFRRLLKISLGGLFGLALLLGGLLAIFSPAVIQLLDPSPAFSASSDVLRILVWSFPLLCANSIIYAALLVLNDQKRLAFLLGSIVIVNVGLNAAFIPQMGITAAALTTVASELLLLVLYSVRYFWRMPSTSAGEHGSG